MAVSRELEEYVVEQLSGLGTVTPRRMFGGVGLYLDGLFFGLIGPDSGALFLKVGDENRPDYEALGMPPFKTYRNRDTVMSYYQVPAEVLEDRRQLEAWARRALRVAGGAGAPSRPRPARGCGAGRQPGSPR